MVTLVERSTASAFRRGARWIGWRVAIPMLLVFTSINPAGRVDAAPMNPSRLLITHADSAPLAPGAIGEPPLDAEEGFIDTALPAQTAIDPAAFVDIFARTPEASRAPAAKVASVQDDVAQRLAALAAATTAEDAVATLPTEALQYYPELAAFIEQGTLPAALTAYTGEYVPGAPEAGTQLLPGYPGPYGFYSPNQTNNWAMPNSPTGGCGTSFLNVPDTGPYFDFSRACRQHDLAYRWAPVFRLEVEHRLLREMLYDCSLRSRLTGALCGIQAGIYATATTVFGGPFYGNPTPGYSAPGDAVVWSPTSQCAQSSHVWVSTGGFGPRVPNNRSLYFTGVIRQHSRARFLVTDSAGNVVLEHTTHASYTNCVIHHEPERVSANTLPNGVYQVRALFNAWENDQLTEVNLGTLEIYTATGSTSCNQYSHAWVIGTESPRTVGAVIYPTGIVHRFTTAQFDFVNAQGAVAYQHTTQPSRSNCVIHQEPEAQSTAGWTPGVYTIRVTYVEWETDQVVTRVVGTLNLQAGDGGGGGGGGGGCDRLNTGFGPLNVQPCDALARAT